MVEPEHPDPETLIAALYHAILGRSPDSAGFAHHVGRLRAGESAKEIARDFIECPESPFRWTISLGPLDRYPANEIELDLSPEQRRSLWERVARIWSKLGKDDPYWSVLSWDQYRSANMTGPESIAAFYDSGRLDVERAEAYLGRHGRRLSGGVCVDYGCGLGRTTLWLARRFEKVLALDVSQPHLEKAASFAAAQGVANIEFHQVRGPRDLELLQGADFFHSILVLQHNPPPLIADILSATFNGLNPGGCAFFQLPTYLVDYSWYYQEYLNQPLSFDPMGIHVLPQSSVFRLAEAAGSALLEVQPDHCIGAPIGISNTFVVAKPGSRL